MENLRGDLYLLHLFLIKKLLKPGKEIGCAVAWYICQVQQICLTLKNFSACTLESFLINCFFNPDVNNLEKIYKEAKG